jgi:hypothetical protein
VRSKGEYELLAWASKIAGPTFDVEPEALFFPKARALGVQWHPEAMGEKSFATQWVLSKLEEYLQCA